MDIVGGGRENKVGRVKGWEVEGERWGMEIEETYLFVKSSWSGLGENSGNINQNLRVRLTLYWKKALQELQVIILK